ncbi:phosphorylase family protein [Streptomyces griseosporeus]|uniref:phosphorylase family protein n=1 Tax=Streptomyces griseosporeus TaxID=1910 RepID=UPI0036FADA94
MTDSPPTVVILTALPVEYLAVRAHLTDVRRREHPSGTVFDCGRLADTGFTAALALIGEGNETAALITEQAHHLFSPRALLFVGVAGGLSDELEIGDVVVGTRIYAYHGAKVSSGTSLARPRAWEASWRLLQAALHATFDADVTVRYKPIAAGEVVLNDRSSGLAAQLRQSYNDAAAIEMESAGVGRAAHLLGRLDALTIRGISDKADGHKHAADARGMQQLAATRAASAAVAVLRELGRSVVEAAGAAGTDGAGGPAGPGLTQGAGVGAGGAAQPTPVGGVVPETTASSSPGAVPAAPEGRAGLEVHEDAVPPRPGRAGEPDAVSSPTGARETWSDRESDGPGVTVTSSGRVPGTVGPGGTDEPPRAHPAGSGAALPAAGPRIPTAGPRDAVPRTHGPSVGPQDAVPLPLTATGGPEDATPRAHTPADGPGDAVPHSPTTAGRPVPGTTPAHAQHSGESASTWTPQAGVSTPGARTSSESSPTPESPSRAHAATGTPEGPHGSDGDTGTRTGTPGPAGNTGTPTTGTGSDGGTGTPTGHRPPRRLPALGPLTRHPRASLVGLALAVVLAVLFGTLWPGGGSGGGESAANSVKKASALPSCPAGTADTTLRIAASVDLSKSLIDAATAYGAHKAQGHCVKIAVDGVNSGTAMRALAAGWSEADGPAPDVWSPAGSDWLALARTRATPEALRKLPETSEPIVTSPLTIAMPEPMARALGWPEQRVGWKDLAQWAENPQDFWARRGQKQWGALKLGKTNPDYSTSGLNATIGAFYARTGTVGELSEQNVDDPGNQKLVRAIEKSVVHYGDTTLTFLANLRAADDKGGREEALRYISAVTVEESSVVAYNRGYPCGAYSDEPGCARTSPPTTKLLSVYPKDSNPRSDHPYITLNGLPAQKTAVAGDFLRYLHDRSVFDAFFAPYGFRTHDGRPGAQVTQANGARDDVELTQYHAPKGPVLARVQEVWAKLRRPADVLVVIDTSTSMDDKVPGEGRTKMELLKAAEPALFGQFGPQDRVGLWKFSNAANMGGVHHYQQLVPVGPLDERPPGADTTRRKQLTREVQGLVPNGATGLYGTVDAAVASLRASYDPDAINAIVLLTDGRNEGVPDKPTLSDVLSRIGTPDRRVRVFTIAYGAEADQQDRGGRTVLEKIATATGGRAYDARDPKAIVDVLTSVISNF